MLLGEFDFADLAAAETTGTSTAANKNKLRRPNWFFCRLWPSQLTASTLYHSDAGERLLKNTNSANQAKFFCRTVQDCTVLYTFF
jgi:hypothetical protein